MTGFILFSVLSLLVWIAFAPVRRWLWGNGDDDLRDKWESWKRRR